MSSRSSSRSSSGDRTWRRRIPSALVLALVLAACAPPAPGAISLMFDQPMVPEAVGQTLLRCGIHDTPWQTSLEVWQIGTDVSRAQLDCLRRQPHVRYIHPAE